jgi:hypothetical protein
MQLSYPNETLTRMKSSVQKPSRLTGQRTACQNALSCKTLPNGAVSPVNCLTLWRMPRFRA